MRDLNAAISAAITQTPGARVSIGPGVTWGALPVAGYFPSLVAQGDASAIQFYVTSVASTGTPAAKVAKGAAKPLGATVSTGPAAVAKYAATALLAMEDYEQSESVVAAVAQTLLAQCAVAQDADAVAALDAAVAEATPAASYVAAISAAQAAVAAKGGRPSLIVIPAVDWAKLASEIATSSGLVSPAGDALLSVLGSRVVISPTAPAGEGFVVDPDACLTILRDVGVAALTGYNDTNEIRVTVDVFATTFVTRPAGVAAFAKT